MLLEGKGGSGGGRVVGSGGEGGVGGKREGWGGGYLRGGAADSIPRPRARPRAPQLPVPPELTRARVGEHMPRWNKSQKEVKLRLCSTRLPRTI